MEFSDEELAYWQSMIRVAFPVLCAVSCVLNMEGCKSLGGMDLLGGRGGGSKWGGVYQWGGGGGLQVGGGGG